MIFLLLTSALRRVKVKVWNRQTKHVTCQRCATDYAYDLVRHADGDAMHLAFIGEASAQERARRSGHQQSQRMTREQAEMVPCPGCGWVNDHLTRTYGWWRHSAGAVKVILSFLLGLLLMCMVPALLAMPLYRWPGLQVVAAAVGVAACALLPVWVLLYYALRRKLLRPNRRYPAGPPVVPPGTPMPQVRVRDPASGRVEYVTVPVEMDTGIKPGAGLVLHVKDCGFPPACCVCLSPALPSHRLGADRYFGEEEFVPVCEACSRRIRRWLGVVIGQGVALLALGALLVYGVNQPAMAKWAPAGLLVYVLTLPLWVMAVRLDYFWRIKPFRFRVLDVHRGICLFKPRDPDYLGLMLERQMMAAARQDDDEQVDR